jgi:hypothetical protein
VKADWGLAVWTHDVKHASEGGGDLSKSLVLPKQCGQAFSREEGLKVSVLLMRPWPHPKAVVGARHTCQAGTPFDLVFSMACLTVL